MSTYLGKKKAFADVLKLKILRLDHPGLSRWAINPMMSVLIRDKKGEEIEEKAK